MSSEQEVAWGQEWRAWWGIPQRKINLAKRYQRLRRNTGQRLEMLQEKHRVVRWTRPLPKQDEADGYKGAAKLRSERQNAKSAEEQMELPKISLTKGNYSRNHHAFVSSLLYPSSSSGTKKWSMCSSRGSRHSRVYRLQSKSGRRKAELGRYLPPPLI